MEVKKIATQVIAFDDLNDDPSSEEKDEGFEKEEEVIDVYSEKEVLVSRKIMSARIEEEHEQRTSLFQTKCRVQDTIVDFIVDSGSEVNAISKELVDHLSLATQRHPRPYKLNWLDQDQQAQVRRQCLVKFKIGPYHDEVLCDVVHMDVCHLLMGRPWQSDKRSLHDGFANEYTITHGGKKMKLKPLPPSQCIPSKLVTKGSCFATRTSLFMEKGHASKGTMVAPFCKGKRKLFKQGDLVYVNVKSKTSPRSMSMDVDNFGPYVIKAKASSNSYVVFMNGIDVSFHVDLLSAYDDDGLEDLRANPFQEGEDDENIGEARITNSSKHLRNSKNMMEGDQVDFKPSPSQVSSSKVKQVHKSKGKHDCPKSPIPSKDEQIVKYGFERKNTSSFIPT